MLAVGRLILDMALTNTILYGRQVMRTQGLISAGIDHGTPIQDLGGLLSSPAGRKAFLMGLSRLTPSAGSVVNVIGPRLEKRRRLGRHRHVAFPEASRRLHLLDHIDP
jgi:hypothetical protein